MVTLHIGFDDTDSPRGGCTTYIAALLVEKLQTLGASFDDYANLVRLNPNVPWKTRGNGALCLRITCRSEMVDRILETVADTVEENSDIGFEGTDPGIVFLPRADIPLEIRAFAKKAIQSIVDMKQALRLVKKFKAEALGFGTGYGIVGALAAIGETLDGDHTYEVIAYRTPGNRGTPRRLDPVSIREMDLKTSAITFNNIDSKTGRILITPGGPDPVLYGIRGETALAVVEAHRLVRPLEPVERWVVFRTNHGTDAHLRRIENVSDIRPFHPVIAAGTVASYPKIVPRRHRIFALRDETGTVDCAAYEPTGTLRKVARRLMPGDRIEVHGGVRPSTGDHPLTVNLEKLRILNLTPDFITHNPECRRCGKRMKSMGRNQGYRCPKCKYQSTTVQKVILEEKRKLNQDLYITSPRSQRHLTKPRSRYGREKTGIPEEVLAGWHYP
jgi:tRNA(Ile2)-agmatinylcytidine synthase